MIQLVTIPEEKMQTLFNLYQLYLHDLSRFEDDYPLDEHGLFDIGNTDLYWKKEQLFPYFINSNDQIAGFALLTGPPYSPKGVDFAVQEFFILNAYRRKGVGQTAANLIFQRHPGKYSISQLAKNLPAVSFWRNVLQHNQFVYEEYEELLEEKIPAVSQVFRTER